jgi:hypothetical protein
MRFRTDDEKDREYSALRAGTAPPSVKSCLMNLEGAYD